MGHHFSFGRTSFFILLLPPLHKELSGYSYRCWFESFSAAISFLVSKLQKYLVLSWMDKRHLRWISLAWKCCLDSEQCWAFCLFQINLQVRCSQLQSESSVGRGDFLRETLNDFSPTLENMSMLPCIQSQAFILGCYVYLDPGSFSLVSVSWCVSHLCMIWDPVLS